MAKKKTRPAEVVKTSTASKTGGSNVIPGKRTQLAMAWAGAAMGYLAGLNHWPARPAELDNLASQAAWFGGVLGITQLDRGTATQGGFLGMVVGMGLALSFLMSERKMLLTWVLAGLGMAAGAFLGHNPAAAGGGWVLGWLIGFALPAR
jgi:hypothetical protein